LADFVLCQVALDFNSWAVPRQSP